jgi:hypothetical protein
MHDVAEITGGCFCGAIRYAFASGNYPAANCHCSMCRRTSAAPYVAWVVVPHNAFHYRAGTPAVLKSSRHGCRYFCARCGTHLACFIDSHPDVIDVTIGSLDQPEAFIPRIDVHTDTRLSWLSPSGEQ